jgi:hypothetical protein
MWSSRTKNDLIIEVWEKLDCENVGRTELEAIEMVLMDHFGPSAVDPPMVLARLLANEGAELRHAEIMELHVERASDQPYAAAVHNLLNVSDLRSAAGSIRRLENLRIKYLSDNDKTGIRHIRETVQRAKSECEERSGGTRGEINAEIALWLRIWLQTPEIFSSWFDLRLRSPEFIEKFGSIE